jgi:pyridoxal 5'-phosphate synthase pdxT subunit
MKIGVLALQGAFIEHIQTLEKLNLTASAVRLPGELAGLDGLIIPGGESTSILKIMTDFAIMNPLRKLVGDGFPVWGTCAGMICLAKHVSTDGMITIGMMDISVKRNAFGRQVESFETDLEIPVLGPALYHAVFIRAPVVSKVGKAVQVIAKLDDGTPVAARQDRMLVTSFHPELTEDFRFHKYFIDVVSGRV